MKNNDALIDFAQFLKDKDADIEKDLDKHFDEYIKQTGIDPDAFISSLTGEHTVSEEDAEDAYDYMELAESAATAKEALKYAKKALALEPENWDAAVMIAQISANSPESLLEKYEKLIAEAEAVMIRDGWFTDEYTGEFWWFLETRPYMRLRNEYLATLIECSMLKKAIQQAEDMLRLCENDNLGIRYGLMHLYAYFEEEESASELLNKYPEESSLFLLPLSFLYYKLGDLQKAAQYLRKLKETNRDTLKFFNALIKGHPEDIFEEDVSFGYQPFTIQELAVAFQQNTFLYGQSASFFAWGQKKLKGMKNTQKPRR